MGNTYTDEEKQVGEWVRQLAEVSERKWKQFYHTGAWKKKRLEILTRDHWMCCECRAKGRYTRATTVHHVRHLRDEPELALTDSNLQSLCDKCHEDKHPELHRYGPSRASFKNAERW